MSECLGVPNKMNSSKDIFYARSNDGAAMVEKTKLECDLGGFECDVSNEVLGSMLRKSVECLTETSSAS